MGVPKVVESEELAKPAEALEEMLGGDVLDIEELAKYPEIRGLAPRYQAILCAYACGYATRFIADMVGMKQPNVMKIIDKYDPDRMFKIGPDAKKAFMTRIIESRMAEAITSITPEKLKASSAKELMSITKDGASIVANMNQSKHTAVRPGKLASLLEAVEQERIANLGSAEVLDDGSEVIQ